MFLQYVPLENDTNFEKHNNFMNHYILSWAVIFSILITEPVKHSSHFPPSVTGFIHLSGSHHSLCNNPEECSSSSWWIPEIMLGLSSFQPPAFVFMPPPCINWEMGTASQFSQLVDLSSRILPPMEKTAGNQRSVQPYFGILLSVVKRAINYILSCVFGELWLSFLYCLGHRYSWWVKSMVTYLPTPPPKKMQRCITKASSQQRNCMSLEILKQENVNQCFQSVTLRKLENMTYFEK